MAEYIEISTDALNRDRNTIESELDQIRAGVNQLREQMEQLGSMWEGPSHDVFLRQFQADYNYILEFQKQLEEYIAAMEYAGKEYKKCESSVLQAISSIRV
ncbi:MAG: WXG100 family type VII secretion target [Lachnospiraceae bacterium]|nr:WXG100 family type VII secretion target [Lachnospiraceae bacterium]